MAARAMMAAQRPAVVILAAGKGTRMRSHLPKVLHPVAGRPMLAYGLDLARELDAGRVVVVVGHQARRVREAFSGRPGLRFVVQEPQLGTGHAVMAAAPELEGWGGPVLILCGDVPALRPATLAGLLRRQERGGLDFTVLAMKLEDPGSYGRLVVDDSGRLLRIVEFRDAGEEERRIHLVNAGVYAARVEPLLRCLPLLRPDNDQGEYYLTDVVELLNEKGYKAGYQVCPDPREVAGINSREDLARMEEMMRELSRESGG